MTENTLNLLNTPYFLDTPAAALQKKVMQERLSNVGLKIAQPESVPAEMHGQVDNDKADITYLKSQQPWIKVLEHSLSTQNAVLESISREAEDFSNQLRTGLSLENKGDISVYKQQAAALRQQLIHLLNTQFEGIYVFSGDNLTQAPVKDDVPEDYYQGGSDYFSVNIAGVDIEYAVRADNPAFQNLFTAYKNLEDMVVYDPDIARTNLTKIDAAVKGLHFLSLATNTGLGILSAVEAETTTQCVEKEKHVASFNTPARDVLRDYAALITAIKSQDAIDATKIPALQRIIKQLESLNS